MRVAYIRNSSSANDSVELETFFYVNGSFHGVFDESHACLLLRIVAIVHNSDITTTGHNHRICAPKL
jgi:hypothetical protein